MGKELGEGHHAKIVERQVDKLDRTVVEQAYRRSGSAPFDPIVMLKMVLYQHLKGNREATFPPGELGMTFAIGQESLSSSYIFSWLAEQSKKGTLIQAKARKMEQQSQPMHRVTEW